MSKHWYLFFILTAVSVLTSAQSAQELFEQSEQFLFKKDYKSWFETAQKAADKGSPDAMTRLGDGYMYGVPGVVSKDLLKAVGYYEKAANLGYKDGMYMLGNAHRELGTYSKALQVYGELSSKGLHDATQLLGEAYLTGEGVGVDANNALNLFTKGMNAGHAGCAYNIGFMYRNGRGVPKDVNKALAQFEKAGQMGDGGAYYALGEMYLQGVETGQDVQKAFGYFQMGEKIGHATCAMYCSALIMAKKVPGTKADALKYAYRSKELGFDRADALINEVSQMPDN